MQHSLRRATYSESIMTEASVCPAVFDRGLTAASTFSEAEIGSEVSRMRALAELDYTR
jgi:hypothetical protein